MRCVLASASQLESRQPRVNSAQISPNKELLARIGCGQPMRRRPRRFSMPALASLLGSAAQGIPSVAVMASPSKNLRYVVFSAFAIAAVCLKVVPQQPPIMVAPAFPAKSEYSAISSGLPGK